MALNLLLFLMPSATLARFAQAGRLLAFAQAGRAQTGMLPFRR